MGRLANKVALITGGSTGIGQACMQLFAREGATVVGVARTQAKLDETLKMVEQAGGKGAVYAADVSNPDDVEVMVKKVIADHGRVDVLLNGAGVGYSWELKSPGSMADVVNTPIEKWREVMGINLDSMFYVSRQVIPHMQKQGRGSIINIASILGLRGMRDAHAYTTAKGAIINLTRSLALAYVDDGIRSNCLAPGYIDTPMISTHVSAFDDAAVAAQLCPMKRAGRPEEIAYGALYLASDEASYTNGTILNIDGGTLAAP